MILGDYGKVNLSSYRTAKGMVRKSKLGVYTKVDSAGRVVIYFMHSNLNKLKLLCYFIGMPKYFIRVEKKPKYGYNYIRLIDTYVDKAINFMKESNKWKRL